MGGREEKERVPPFPGRGHDSVLRSTPRALLLLLLLYCRPTDIRRENPRHVRTIFSSFIIIPETE